MVSIDSKIPRNSKLFACYYLKTFAAIKETKEWLNKAGKEGKTIGFVPTMGALHKGHIALLERAKQENGIAVASIFVNPLQFNDKKDLEKYPRTLDADLAMLNDAGCDIAFTPSANEMYPASPLNPLSSRRGEKGAGVESGEVFDLGSLDKVMEGAQRPGHFKGVCTVVKLLFDIVEPTRAYFGEKDFQQLAVIKHMVKTLNLPVEIVPCPTVREKDGLAMSSRNTLLSADERKNAPLIYKTMIEAKEKFTPTLQGAKEWVAQQINSNRFMQLEYFEIVNAETLQPITDNRPTITALRACIAVKMGSVRLIDNIPF